MGFGLTVTTTVADLVQPLAEVPVMVYVVVAVGQALTLAPVVALRAVAGVQVYVVAPEAVRVTQTPWQTVAGFGATVTVGEGLTITVAVAVPEPQGPVPVTVYVVVTVGQAVGEAPVVALSPVAGDQVYDVPPVPVTVPHPPWQIVEPVAVIATNVEQLTCAVPKKLSGIVVVNEL